MKGMTYSVNFAKIIFFDEESALDFLDLQQGGRFYFSQDKIKDYQNSASAEVQAGTKIPFLNLLFSGRGNSSISREGNKLIQSTLSNTVLNDFIDKADKVNSDVEIEIPIYIYQNTKVEIVKESYAYFKLITPFTKLLEEKVIETDDANINLSELDEMLENAKGYYELLAKQGVKEFILRFNSKSFRNNYRIFDLEKMDLTYLAVKVGACRKSELLLINQLPKDFQNNRSTKNVKKHENIVEAFDEYKE